MIAWWWTVAVFYAGVAIGFFVCALFAAAGKADDEREEHMN